MAKSNGGTIAKYDRDARRLADTSLALLAVVSMGWMAGIGLGFAVADSTNSSFIENTLAILTPGLQGVIAIAITSVGLVLYAITRRIRIRAHSLGQALPRLLPAAKEER